MDNKYDPGAEITIARAILDEHYPKYKSQIEEDWATMGNMILGDEGYKDVAVQRYEPITFNIPGGKYTPDFMHILADGRMIFVEVKGSKRQKNYRDARSKLRAAAELHQWFTFIEAIGRHETWELEVI